jgi:ribosomal protein L29
VYGAQVNTQMCVRKLQKEQLEQVCRQLGMPTASEVSSLGQRLQELRRELRELKQQAAVRSTPVRTAPAPKTVARKAVKTAVKKTPSRKPIPKKAAPKPAASATRPAARKAKSSTRITSRKRS